MANLIGIINAARKRNAILALQYVDRNGEPSERNVSAMTEPLERGNGATTFYAICHERSGEKNTMASRQFRVDRIVSVAVIDVE